MFRSQFRSRNAPPSVERLKLERERFDLRRQKIYLAVELVTAALTLAIAVTCWFKGEVFLALAFLGGGAWISRG